MAQICESETGARADRVRPPARAARPLRCDQSSRADRRLCTESRSLILVQKDYNDAANLLLQAWSPFGRERAPRLIISLHRHGVQVRLIHNTAHPITGAVVGSLSGHQIRTAAKTNAVKLTTGCVVRQPLRPPRAQDADVPRLGKRERGGCPRPPPTFMVERYRSRVARHHRAKRGDRAWRFPSHEY